MGSGSTCAIVGCHNNSRKLKVFSETFCVEHKQTQKKCPCPAPYALYSLPTRKKERRAAWLAALRLKHPPKRVYVCSFHFVDKRPTELHPDPELYLGDDQPPSKRPRITSGADKYCSVDFTSAVPDHADISTSTHPPVDPELHDHDYGMVASRKKVHDKTTQCDDFEYFMLQIDSGALRYADRSVDLTSTVPDHADISTSTHPPMDPALHDHDYGMVASRKNVHDKIIQCDDSGYVMLQNDWDALHYTGISLEVFNILVSTLEGHVSNAFPMSVRDQVLMTLMKLRTNHVTGYLSKQFFISESMASKIISYWIDKLDELLQPLIPWLPRETIQATMPETFKEKFPNTTCIVHCTDCLVQKTQNLDSKWESYSHYYDKMKYLVAVAPCGLIMFISTAYQEQCTDKHITFDSGILDYLMPGDEVMAEQGSSIEDLQFAEKNFSLVMNSFRAEKEETCATQTADVTADVERAITRLKVYKILTQVVSKTLALKINKILRICSALVNLREEVIHDSH